MCEHNGNPDCSCPTRKEFSDTTAPNRGYVPEVWEPTIEQIDAAMNHNPGHAIPATPGKSGSSEVYRGGQIGRGLRLLKGFPAVTRQELARADKWDSDFDTIREIPYTAPKVILNRTLSEFPELAKEARELCDKCEVTPHGISCRVCKLGGISGQNKVLP